jgi:hypothetical protein
MKKSDEIRYDVEAASTPQLESNQNSEDLVNLLGSIERNLIGLKINLSKRTDNYSTAKLLNSNYQPSLDDRMQIVETAIDLLVDQMDYYRLSSQKDRENLVGYLKGLGEVERWGYVVNMLSNITKPGSVPDTFLRSIEPPDKNREAKK